MPGWLLVTGAGLSAIQSQNIANLAFKKRIEPVELKDGRLILYDDLIGSSIWADWNNILIGFTTTVVLPSDFKSSPLDTGLE